MPTPTDVPTAGDDLPLLLAASVHHPDRNVRLDIRRSLYRWVEDAAPLYTAREVDRVLRSQEGTAIEPFVLSRRDRFVSALLARLVFSEQRSQTRFRVVSRETIGNGGGAMLTNNLRSYYIERYAYGYRRRTSERFGFVAPAAMPTAEWIASHKACEAEASIDDEGIRLQIGPFRWPTEMAVEPYRLVSLVQLHSEIRGPTSIPLSRGFRVTHDAEHLEVRTASSEAMLQLGAHMAQGSTLVLAASPKDPRARVFVRLRPLEGEQMRLRSVASVTSGALPVWMRIGPGEGPQVSREVKLAVARWFRPHEDWIDDAMIEELL